MFSLSMFAIGFFHHVKCLKKIKKYVGLISTSGDFRVTGSCNLNWSVCSEVGYNMEHEFSSVYK